MIKNRNDNGNSVCRETPLNLDNAGQISFNGIG
jgi:hypothetical protein